MERYEQVTVQHFIPGPPRLHPQVKLEGLDLTRVSVTRAYISTAASLRHLQKFTSVGLQVELLMLTFTPDEASAPEMQTAWLDFRCNNLNRLSVTFSADETSDSLGILNSLSRYPSLEIVDVDVDYGREFRCVLTRQLYEGAHHSCTLNFSYAQFRRTAGLSPPAFTCTTLSIESDCSDLDAFSEFWLASRGARHR